MSTRDPSSPSGESLPPWDDLVLLGKLTRTQGHRGAVRLLPEFEPLERFEGLKSDELILRFPLPFSPPDKIGRRPPPASPGRAQTVHVQEFSYHQRFIILTLAEAPDMNAAERLQGAEVYVRPEHLWDLDEGEFFAYEVTGFDVVDATTGQSLGSVRGIETGAGHDFLLVRSALTRRDFFIPLVKAMVHNVDKSARRITVSLPEGLEEL